MDIEIYRKDKKDQRPRWLAWLVRDNKPANGYATYIGNSREELAQDMGIDVTQIPHIEPYSETRINVPYITCDEHEDKC